MVLRLIVTLLLTFVLSLSAPAQQSHIRTSINQNSGEASITSDYLYVINMPSQFMRVSLSAHFTKSKTTPDDIQLSFWSYAVKPLYEAEGSHGLRAKVGDQVIDFGLLSYAKESSSSRPGLPAAAVLGKGNSTLAVEMMTARILDHEPLDLINQAQELVMKIGNTVFQFTPAQLSIVREFVAAVSTVGATLSAAASNGSLSPLPPDVPSDQNQAALETTLHWIKAQLEKEGSTNYLGLERKLEPLDFGSCKLRYRLVPLFREVAGSSRLVYAIIEYQLNLADLDTGAIRVADGRDHSTVLLEVEALEPKIKVIKHANENGTTGRTLDEATTASVIINVKNAEAANRLKFALTHAIHLCRDQRK